MDSDVALAVNGLTTILDTSQGTVRAVDDVSWYVRRGEMVALVGESGCGKSVSARSVLGLLPGSARSRCTGEINYGGRNLCAASPAQYQEVRGSEISMIFQDPMTHLDPLMTIRAQIAEVVRCHTKLGKAEVEARVIHALERAHVTDVDRVARSYPHELSGGLRQRALIALALSCDPKVIIADEPTTALDVTTQKQILDDLRYLVVSDEISMVLITHDLGVVANYCDRVYVMYAGQIVEHATVDDFINGMKHPYSRGLMAAAGSLASGDRHLASIPGVVPNLLNPPQGCRFRGRCAEAVAKCAVEDPVPALPVTRPGTGACWRLKQEQTHE